MAAGSTYTPIATTTLGTATNTITFSSIPSTYTDLRLIVSCLSTSADPDVRLTFNSDTSSLYSRTYMYGDGSAAYSGRSSNAANIPSTVFPTWGYIIYDIMNYSNTTTFKTTLIKYGTAATLALAQVGLYRSTSAISSLNLVTSSANFAVGSQFTLYGIQAA